MSIRIVLLNDVEEWPVDKVGLGSVVGVRMLERRDEKGVGPEMVFRGYRKSG